jgi:hypothetical protein
MLGILYPLIAKSQDEKVKKELFDLLKIIEKVEPHSSLGTKNIEKRIIIRLYDIREVLGGKKTNEKATDICSEIGISLLERETIIQKEKNKENSGK